jgi:hypothetical protein
VNASAWDDPLDPVGITTEAVAKQRKPVLRVLHEAGHGGWQFYDDVEPLSGPVVLPKLELLKLDPSLAAVKDLPVGWEATRQSPTSRWVRKKVAQ